MRFLKPLQIITWYVINNFIYINLDKILKKLKKKVQKGKAFALEHTDRPY